MGIEAQEVNEEAEAQHWKVGKAHFALWKIQPMNHVPCSLKIYFALKSSHLSPYSEGSFLLFTSSLNTHIIYNLHLKGQILSLVEIYSLS